MQQRRMTRALPRARTRPTPPERELAGIFQYFIGKENTGRVMLWLVLHIALSFVVFQPFQQSIPATIHAIIVFLLSLSVIFSKTKWTSLIFALAYIVGSETMWRVSGANIFWESAKYMSAFLILLAALIHNRHFKIPAFPLLYLILLLPSVPLTFRALGRTEALEAISFNLSAPFALIFIVLLFHNIELSEEDLFFRIPLATLGPTLTVLAITLRTTFLGVIESGTNVLFGQGRVVDLVTSAYFAPNQISAALSLGAFMSVVAALYTEQKSLKPPLFGLAVVFVGQSMLTFSRGGLFLLGVSLIGAIFYLVRSKRQRNSVIMGILALLLLFNFGLLPLLENLTEGAVITRFQSLDPSGRDLIIEADIDTWMDNPLFGVGPGMSEEEHARTFKSSQAHTEYSRLLADHGLFGLLALILLFTTLLRNVREASQIKHKALVAAAIGWAGAFLAINAMRMAAPAFLFGLTFTKLIDMKSPVEEAPPPRVRQPHAMRHRRPAQPRTSAGR